MGARIRLLSFCMDRRSDGYSAKERRLLVDVWALLYSHLINLLPRPGFIFGDDQKGCLAPVESLAGQFGAHCDWHLVYAENRKAIIFACLTYGVRFARIHDEGVLRDIVRKYADDSALLYLHLSNTIIIKL